MTLSRWLRDYLYIPLGGNRGTKLFTYRNLFLTMVIGGLWHGANWTFVVWGAHPRRLPRRRACREGEVGRAWRHRPAAAARERSCSGCSPSTSSASPGCSSGPRLVADAFECIGRLFTGSVAAPALVTPLLIVTVVAHAGLAVRAASGSRPAEIAFARARAGPADRAPLAVGLVLVDALGPEGIAPFIYFQF